MRMLRVSSVLAFVLAVLAHAESLGYWFTSNDSIALVETSRIGSLGDLWFVLTNPLMAGTTYVEAGEFYRPVVNLTYAVEYWVWGVNPFGYHLTNLLLHGLASVLVVLTVRSLTRSVRTGAIAGVLFAIHPLSTDTVPAVSRRQDIMLGVFGLLALWLLVEGVRREDDRLRIGAAVAYALALGSKEPAVVVGPLAFLWVVLQQPSLRRPETYRRGIVAILPLAVVGVAYLGVRTAVLGGIGGYTHDPPLSQVLVFPFQYVLSLTYQAHLFGVLRDVSLVALVVVAVGIPAVYLVLFGRERSMRDVGGGVFLCVALSVVGFGAMTAVLVVPDTTASLSLIDVDSVEWYAVGVAFGVAAASGVVAALSSGRPAGGDGRRLGVFFAAWLAIPLPLFFVARQFAFRDAYFFVVPLLALLALSLVNGLSRLDSPFGARVRPDGRGEAGPSWDGVDAVLVFAVVVLLLPSLSASPLLYADSGWGAGGDVTRQALTRVDRSVSAVDADTHVAVAGVPTRLRHHPKRLGQARKITMLQPHSIRSWLALQGHENPLIAGRFRSFGTAPRNVSAATARRNGWLLVRLRYS